MGMPPRRIRQLPAALPAKDSDVFPVSQMDDNGSATTRAMQRAQFQQDIIEVINAARQQFIYTANTEHAVINGRLDALEDGLADNTLDDQQMQAAMIMLQQMIETGESGKTPYDLWIEAGNTGSMADYLNSLRGPQGERGLPGESIKGDKGDRGDVGPAGIGVQGPTGLQGEVGPRGERGEIGPSGPAGKDSTVAGPQGIPGKDGKDGLNSTVPGPTGPSAKVSLPDITISGTIAVGLLAGPKTHTISCAGAQVTDSFVLTPAGTMPTGYMLGDVRCKSAGQLEVSLYLPQVALLANYSIPVKVTAIR